MHDGIRQQKNLVIRIFNDKTTASDLILRRELHKLKRETLPELPSLKVELFEKSECFHNDTTDGNFSQKLLTKRSWYLSKNRSPNCASSLFILQKNTSGVFGQNGSRQLFFYHNLCNFYLHHHRIKRDSKGVKRMSFKKQIVRVLLFDDSAVLYFPKKLNKSYTELGNLVNTLSEILKASDQASSCVQFPVLKPKKGIGPTKVKDNLISYY